MSRARRIFRTALWGAVVLVLVAHLAFGWSYSGRIIDEYFVPSPIALELNDASYSYERVTFRSDVGELEALFLPAAGSTWLIHVHGVNTTPGEPEPLFAAIQTAGYPQLSISYRNDQDQPGDPSTYHQYGATEWEDVRGAVDYARANGAQEIVLAGYGAGSSHALSYSFRHNFDDIAGIILDSCEHRSGTDNQSRGHRRHASPVATTSPSHRRLDRKVLHVDADGNQLEVTRLHRES